MDLSNGIIWTPASQPRVRYIKGACIYNIGNALVIQMRSFQIIQNFQKRISKLSKKKKKNSNAMYVCMQLRHYQLLLRKKKKKRKHPKRWQMGKNVRPKYSRVFTGVPAAITHAGNPSG